MKLFLLYDRSGVDAERLMGIYATKSEADAARDRAVATVYTRDDGSQYKFHIADLLDVDEEELNVDMFPYPITGANF